MRYDWSHATLAVTALPLPTTHRSLHGLRCRPHTLITRARPSDVTVDRALYCEPATVRRPLGRAQAGGRQAETQTPIMTSTLWGSSCSLQRRSRGPNGAEILLLFMAPRQCSGREGRWQLWFSTVRCEYELAGKTRNTGLLNLGRLDIKICSLAWVEEAQHGTVAEESL